MLLKEWPNRGNYDFLWPGANGWVQWIHWVEFKDVVSKVLADLHQEEVLLGQVQNPSTFALKTESPSEFSGRHVRFDFLKFQDNHPTVSFASCFSHFLV